jgi:hypothetical protein
MWSTIRAIASVSGEGKEGFEQRKVDRTEVDGLLVSTVYTPDCGYETAVCDEVGTHPVERYVGRDEAVLGHSRWCLEIVGKKEATKLVDADGWLDSEVVTLVRKPA